MKLKFDVQNHSDPAYMDFKGDLHINEGNSITITVSFSSEGEAYANITGIRNDTHIEIMDIDNLSWENAEKIVGYKVTPPKIWKVEKTLDS